MKTNSLQITAQVIFDNGLIIEDGEFILGPCESTLEIGEHLSLLVDSIYDNGVKARAKEDLSWLLQATTDWRPKHVSAPAAALHEDGSPLNELERYVVTLSNELSRLNGLCHKHVKEVNIWYSGVNELKELSFENLTKDATGNWLIKEVRSGIAIERW